MSISHNIVCISAMLSLKINAYFLWCILSLNGFTLYKSVDARLAPLDWWQSTVVYQIYPRSFKDANGDGVGDLKGILEKLPYLKNLGIDCIWLSPIYKSPMADFGYDIANFRDIEPVFGTITDFNRLIYACKKKGIKILLDFVPNHTSVEHPWFVKSVDCIKPYVDYYIWKDAVIVNGERRPPNNWLSVFGGSAWEWNEKRKQYYFHAFAAQQPDLNFRNPVVVEEMKDVLRYWMDQGVDGFRMDAVPFLFEDVQFRDEPIASNHEEFGPTKHDYLNHTYTMDQEETFDMIYQFRELLDSYKLSDGHTRVMLIESYRPLDKTMLYYGNETRIGAHFAFNFELFKLTRQSSSKDFVNIVDLWESGKTPGKWSNWVIGNHDQKRAASRFEPEFIDALHMLCLLLPGTAVTYNGDELGMEDTFIRWDQTIDPQALFVGPKGYEHFSRDFARSPFQWDASPNAGFTSHVRSWLPVNPNYWRKNLAAEKKDLRSHFHVYKALVRLRKTAAIQRGALDMYALSDWVFCFVRSYGDHPTYIVIMNIGSDIEYADILSRRPTLPDTLVVYASSANSQLSPGSIVQAEKIMLRPKEALTLTTVELTTVTQTIIHGDNFNPTLHFGVPNGTS